MFFRRSLTEEQSKQLAGFKQICGQVFQYGIEKDRCEQDPAAGLLRKRLNVQSKPMAAITNRNEIGALMRAIDEYGGQLITRYALQLAALTFVRPGELRQAEWPEIDLEEAMWTISASKMKVKKDKKHDPGYDHLVPLSKQAVNVLRNAQTLTGDGKYVFPSIRSNDRPMSNNTVLAALRRMDFDKTQMTGHGFRAMASTQLYEQGYRSEVIETQLAHVEGNKVKAAYKPG